MKLLNRVKDKLAEKGYDFSDEKWTGEMLTILYDAVYATEEVLRPQEPQWSERKNVTFAFFDKLPNGLREMAKENYEEGYSDEVPSTLVDALVVGFNWGEKWTFWDEIATHIEKELPSITLNGITYDLSKCYE